MKSLVSSLSLFWLRLSTAPEKSGMSFPMAAIKDSKECVFLKISRNKFLSLFLNKQFGKCGQLMGKQQIRHSDMGIFLEMPLAYQRKILLF